MSASFAVKPLHELKKDCKELAHTDPGDTQKIASLLQEMIINYYADVRKQAQQSFYSALGAAVIGTLFFFYAAWLIMQNNAGHANLSLIAGGLVEVISAINFYLYGRAARQFASFHVCLERTNRFLLANTLCENLSCKDRKDEMRAELLRVVANAPMLTLDVLTKGVPQTEVKQSRLIAVRNPESAQAVEGLEGEVVATQTKQTVTNIKQ